MSAIRAGSKRRREERVVHDDDDSDDMFAEDRIGELRAAVQQRVTPARANGSSASRSTPATSVLQSLRVPPRSGTRSRSPDAGRGRNRIDVRGVMSVGPSASSSSHPAPHGSAPVDEFEFIPSQPVEGRVIVTISSSSSEDDQPLPKGATKRGSGGVMASKGRGEKRAVKGRAAVQARGRSSSSSEEAMLSSSSSSSSEEEEAVMVTRGRGAVAGKQPATRSRKRAVTTRARSSSSDDDDEDYEEEDDEEVSVPVKKAKTAPPTGKRARSAAPPRKQQQHDSDSDDDDDDDVSEPEPSPAPRKRPRRDPSPVEVEPSQDAEEEEDDDPNLDNFIAGEEEDDDDDSESEEEGEAEAPNFSYLAVNMGEEAAAARGSSDVGIGLAAALAEQVKVPLDARMPHELAMNAWCRFITAALVLRDPARDVMLLHSNSADAELYRASATIIERRLQSKMDSLAVSTAVKQPVRAMMDMLPFFQSTPISDGDDCEVCGRANHPATYEMKLSGPLIPSAMMYEDAVRVRARMSPSGIASMPWWGDAIPRGALRSHHVSYSTGRVCRCRSECYLALKHFKFHVLLDVAAWCDTFLGSSIKSSTSATTRTEQLYTLTAAHVRDRFLERASDRIQEVPKDNLRGDPHAFDDESEDEEDDDEDDFDVAGGHVGSEQRKRAHVTFYPADAWTRVQRAWAECIMDDPQRTTSPMEETDQEGGEARAGGDDSDASLHPYVRPFARPPAAAASSADARTVTAAATWSRLVQRWTRRWVGLIEYAETLFTSDAKSQKRIDNSALAFVAYAQNAFNARQGVIPAATQREVVLQADSAASAGRVDREKDEEQEEDEEKVMAAAEAVSRRVALAAPTSTSEATYLFDDEELFDDHHAAVLPAASHTTPRVNTAASSRPPSSSRRAARDAPSVVLSGRGTLAVAPADHPSITPNSMHFVTSLPAHVDGGMPQRSRTNKLSLAPADSVPNAASHCIAPLDVVDDNSDEDGDVSMAALRAQSARRHAAATAVPRVEATTASSSVPTVRTASLMSASTLDMPDEEDDEDDIPVARLLAQKRGRAQM